MFHFTFNFCVWNPARGLRVQIWSWQPLHVNIVHPDLGSPDRVTEYGPAGNTDDHRSSSTVSVSGSGLSRSLLTRKWADVGLSSSTVQFMCFKPQVDFFSGFSWLWAIMSLLPAALAVHFPSSLSLPLCLKVTSFQPLILEWWVSGHYFQSNTVWPPTIL